MKKLNRLSKSRIFQNSLFNESDLNISYSQDFNLTKRQQNSTENIFKVQKISKNISTDSLPFSSFANVTDFFNNEDNSSFETVKQEEVQDSSASYSISDKYKIEKQNNQQITKNPEHIESSNSTKISQRDGKQANSKKQFQMRVQLETKFKNKTEEEIKDQLRKIDKEMKELSGHKNRLKYMLRNKDSNVTEELIETKACPCCGKTISKLCFHCEHLYCKKQSCPRMKKQKLNAKMLQKLKEKKGGENKRYRRSRDKLRKREQNKTDKNEKFRSDSSDQFATQSELQYSDNEMIQKQRIKEEKEYKLRSRESNKNVQNFLNFDKTMTDIQLHESNLFVDSEQWA